MTRLSSLVLLVPIMPADHGNGLAMRAGLLLDALSRSYDVHLILAPVAGRPSASWPTFVVDRTVDRLCLEGDPSVPTAPERLFDVAAMERALLPAPARFATPNRLSTVRDACSTLAAIDVVVIMGLYLAPFVGQFRNAAGRPLLVLDLNDDEVTSRRRIAEVRRRRGHHSSADEVDVEADKYRVLQDRWLRTFDLVLVCSEQDRTVIASRCAQTDIHVFPNAVTVPDDLPRPSARADSAFRLLFVGNLSYEPNVDGAVLLCRKVLPLLQERLTRVLDVDIVGSSPVAEVVELETLQGVTVHADVSEVAPYYSRADLVIVPLRAGGGTRLKILEAFARGVPVVSTSIGAEGLDVQTDRHLVIADDPESLAEACRRVLTSPAMANRLRNEARSLVRARYAVPIVVDQLLTLLDEHRVKKPGASRPTPRC
jgi:glycosyltransferase involved in cell wall biosynthesis